MNNKLRQQILKELKLLLNEAPPNPGEAEVVGNILKSQIQRWMNGKITDESFKSILARGIGSGGAEGQAADALFTNLAAQKAKGATAETLTSVAEKEVAKAVAQATKAAGTTAAETAATQVAKKAGTELATTAAEKAAGETAGKTAFKALASETAETTTLALARNQAGKAIVKSAIEKAAAEGLARVAVGQAVGSAVPGVGNIVMGVITGAWLGYDLMMAYVDYKLATSGQSQRDAMKNVREKCALVKQGKSPEGGNQFQEYRDLVKDFAAAISFNTGYLREKYYADCLVSIGNVLKPQGLKNELNKNGVNLDILSKDELCKNFGICEENKPSPTPAPQENPAQQPGVQGAFGEKGRSFTCNNDPGIVVKFQKWLKKNGAKIVADGNFGPATFAAAKSISAKLGGGTFDFSMYPNFDAFKDVKGTEGPQQGGMNRVRLCTDLAKDPRWSKEDPTPEKAPVATRKPVANTSTQATTPNPVAAPDVSLPGQRRAGINPKTEGLSREFYDRKKIKNAEVLYEKLVKATTKGKL